MAEKFMDFVNRIINRKVYLDGFGEPIPQDAKVKKYIYESVFPDEYTMEMVQNLVKNNNNKETIEAL